ncbi:hypothetical protein K8640_00390 [Myxococcus sp. XM-1-1-1]|uniref:hypothetical protein n=1 Tax=unclassified Myxococcus TaxID=2648731 RepID=UPI0011429926|nr:MULTISPECIES: hypothetical protein [unclassified Myxococcus]MBZ4406660.1 hypothetical protein [Myxococcus sp. XM-1-1-1]
MLPLIALLLLTAAPPTPPQVTPEPKPPPEQPRPQCITAQGRELCGFQCRTSGSKAGCAQTPYGTCQVLRDEVHCWDPPRVAIQHPPRTPVRPECKAVRGKVDCGFNCRIFNGEVACNSTPYGLCDTHFGRLVCWDPPDSVIHEYAQAMPAARCLNASEAIACGFDCKASRTEVRCTNTPRGVCTLNDQRLTCFDPPSLLHCDHSNPPPPPH